MDETIYICVKVRISYPDKSRRQEAIKKAKSCVLSSSIYGTVGAIPKFAKLMR